MNSKKKQKKSTADFLFRRERCKDLPRIKTGVGRCARVPRGVPTYRHDCGISSFTSFASQNSWKKKEKKNTKQNGNARRPAKIRNRMAGTPECPQGTNTIKKVSPNWQILGFSSFLSFPPFLFFLLPSFPPSFLLQILVDPSEYGSV